MYKAVDNKISNRNRILECIYRNPKISRKEISDLTGITPATVTTSVAAMIQEGLVAELGQVEEDRGTIGRSRIALDICASYGCVIGVEFTEGSLTTCATDLHGNLCYNHSIPQQKNPGVNITQRVIDSIQLCRKSLPTERIVGIGIAVPGHMDANCHHLISSTDHWVDFDGRAVRSAFSCPVVFENNVRCMAAAEYLHHPAETPSNFALFHVGHGMFCANVADDELYIGTTYGSGEIAHTIAVVDGKRCSCGKRGCLQTVATEGALLENASVLFETDPNTVLHGLVSQKEDLTLSHIITAYTMGDPAVMCMVTQALKYLAVAALNVAVLMNPQKLFLHGRLFASDAIRRDLLDMISHQFYFTRNNYHLGTVEFLSSTPTDGSAGACALAILKCMIHA